MASVDHVQTRLTLLNTLGLHARAAATFVQALKDLQVEISVRYEGRTANGRSVLDLLTLGAPQGSVLDVQISGIDAQAALAVLTTLVDHRFYEE